MDGNSEVFPNRLNALDSGHCRFCFPQTRYVVENLGGHLVAPLGTTLTGQQSSQAGPAESTLRLIERGPRYSKRSGRLENRYRLDAVPPQHLVADLEKISGIEERVVFEQRIGNGFRVWIESAGAFQFQHLLVGLCAFGYPHYARRLCNNNYASYAKRCQVKSSALDTCFIRIAQ